MALQQGLSGLDSATSQLNIIGNNIANSSTVGYKSGSVEFADVYANSLNGGGASNIGIGVQTAATQQDFSQGTITTSTNPLDIAINGKGFFQVSTAGALSYTRNGQFQLDKSGNLVTATGANLQGYSATATGVLNTGSPTNININTANLAPVATKNVGTELNLDSRLPVLPAASFSSTDPTTYSYSTSVSVYDSLGDSHALQTYYVNTGPAAPVAPATTGEATWSVFATVDGTPVGYVPPAAPVAVATLAFKSDGSLDTASSTPVPSPATPTTFSIPLSMTLANGATTPQTVAMAYTGTTQYGSAVGVNAQTQDGYTSGQLSNFTAGANGDITGTYSNGQTAVLGQIVLANFVNPNGLESIGGNQYAVSPTSGSALVGAPETGSLGALQSGATESSNTDLTAELVDMITAQRDYQANAQTLKTEDQIMQTLVTLR